MKHQDIFVEKHIKNEEYILFFDKKYNLFFDEQVYIHPDISFCIEISKIKNWTNLHFYWKDNSNLDFLKLSKKIATFFVSNIFIDKNPNDQWNEEFIMIDEKGDFFTGNVDLNADFFEIKNIKKYNFENQ